MKLTKSAWKDLRALTRQKHRELEGKFFIEGVRMLQEAAESDFSILEVMHTEDLAAEAAGRALLQKLQRKTGNIHEVSRRELSMLSETVHSQGVVAVVRQKKWTVEELLRGESPRTVLVAFDAVADPGNLGSMIRTCDWFGVDGILLGENSVELYNPKVLRATMGGVFHLRVAERVDLLTAVTRAKEQGFAIYVTDGAGETHFDRVQFASKAVIIFGNEAWGVSDQLKRLADVRVAIRRYGAAESLNVGVACGIILSGLHRLYAD